MKPLSRKYIMMMIMIASRLINQNGSSAAFLFSLSFIFITINSILIFSISFLVFKSLYSSFVYSLNSLIGSEIFLLYQKATETHIGNIEKNKTYLLFVYNPTISIIPVMISIIVSLSSFSILSPQSSKILKFSTSLERSDDWWFEI